MAQYNIPMTTQTKTLSTQNKFMQYNTAISVQGGSCSLTDSAGTTYANIIPTHSISNATSPNSTNLMTPTISFSTGGGNVSGTSISNSVPSGFYIDVTSANSLLGKIITSTMPAVSMVHKAGWIDAGTTNYSSKSQTSQINAGGNSRKVYISVQSGSLANTGTTGKTYTELSEPELKIDDGYLYINEGYFKNSKISLGKLIPDIGTIVGDDENSSSFVSEYLVNGKTAFDEHAHKIVGSMAEVSWNSTYYTTDNTGYGEIPVRQHTGVTTYDDSGNKVEPAVHYIKKAVTDLNSTITTAYLTTANAADANSGYIDFSIVSDLYTSSAGWISSGLVENINTQRLINLSIAESKKIENISVTDGTISSITSTDVSDVIVPLGNDFYLYGEGAVYIKYKTNNSYSSVNIQDYNTTSYTKVAESGALIKTSVSISASSSINSMSGTNATLSTTNNSGIAITAVPLRSAITYTNNSPGWLDRHVDTQYASSVTGTSMTRYLSDLTIPADKRLNSINIQGSLTTLSIDAGSNYGITNVNGKGMNISSFSVSNLSIVTMMMSMLNMTSIELSSININYLGDVSSVTVQQVTSSGSNRNINIGTTSKTDAMKKTTINLYTTESEGEKINFYYTKSDSTTTNSGRWLISSEGDGTLNFKCVAD